MTSHKIDKFAMPRTCICKQTDADPVVRNGLAITPARMLELTYEGMPISEQTANFTSDFIDGYKKLDFEPPHIYTRHADIISCYEQQLDSRNLINAYESTSVASERSE